MEEQLKKFENKPCEKYWEYQRTNKRGEVYWDRKFIAQLTYKPKDGDELTRRGNVLRPVKEGREIFIFRDNPLKEKVDDAEEYVEETPEEYLASSICGIVNALLECPNTQIIKLYVKNNRVYAQYKSTKNEVLRTASNPLVMRK